MRFRSFGSFPSFFGYIGGCTFLRGAAYAMASGWGRALGRSDWVHPLTRAQFRAEVKRKLREQGVLPPIGYKSPVKATAPYFHQPSAKAYVAKPYVPKSKPVFPTPSPKARPAPYIGAKSGVRRAVGVKTPYVPRPAAVSRNGGIRGSSATKWK